jgi:hypothetical protein
MEFSEIMLQWQDDNPNLLGDVLWVSANQNQEPLTTNGYEIFLPLFFLNSRGKVSSLCLPACRSVCYIAGACVEILH